MTATPATLQATHTAPVNILARPRQYAVYLRDLARYAHDYCEWAEEQHMTRINARIDAILGLGAR